MFGTRFVGQSSGWLPKPRLQTLDAFNYNRSIKPCQVFGWKCRSRTYKQMVQSHRALPVCVTSNANMVSPTGIEPVPSGLQPDEHTVYTTATLVEQQVEGSTFAPHVARLAGFEPTLPDSESGVLPLDDGRMFGDLYGDRTRLYTVDSRAPHQSAYRPRE